MNNKRLRDGVDSQLTKEEFENEEYSEASKPMDFPRGTPQVLAQRRLVTARRQSLSHIDEMQNNKKEQFIRHVSTLNKSFYEWYKNLMPNLTDAESNCDLVDGFQDYIDYATELEDRFLRSYGEVLTFGSGDCGQLAHGIENDEDLMVKYPRIVYTLRDKKVYGISCGGIHNAAYTATGQVYTWGCADDGALGRVGEEFTPLLVEGLANETIIGVDCGDCHTVAVSIKGEVWGWGCYKDKEGKKFFNPSKTAANPMKDMKKQQDVPLLIQGLPANIVAVASGAVFNLARSADGRIYSWGLGECGELGREVPEMKKTVTIDGEQQKDYDLPSILKHHITPDFMYTAPNTPIGDVKSFGCGAYHSMVITVGDVVYACGLNNYGQLGLGQKKTNNGAVADTDNRSWLTRVTSLDDKGIVCVKGGVHHSLALSSKGSLWAFGRSDSGQLGCSSRTSSSAGDFSSSPVSPALPANTIVTSIACGGNHNLVLTDGNAVYTWGYGDMLALGHGEEKDETLPRKLNFDKAKKFKHITVTQVAGGGQHSAIIGQVVDVKHT
mmetsp:Transcript_13263/g.18178  ORF Transcript_13263/g.18178 Transcript_13263/m.18178 type:complete len:552 (+) Transcript_13263:2-1657(+)